jgi:hypothetical protein
MKLEVTQIIRNTIAIGMLMVICHNTNAQTNLSAYTDVFNKFYCFDNGATSELEYLAPREYKVGRTGIAYLDNLGIFKVYRYGVMNKVNTNFTSAFGVSDNFIFYKTQTSLHVIDADDDIELCRSVGEYAVGDSIILYYDRIRNILNAYYGGKTIELETNLATNTHDNFKVSDNVIAYTNFMDQFKVLMYGETQVLEAQPVQDYQVGRNIVAYTDINNQFKICTGGEPIVADAFAPKRYTVGDNVVAFVGYDGYFKIFYEGKVHQIGYFDKRFLVSDYVVAFEDGAGFFKVFYKGNIYDIDNFYPEKFLLGYRSMTYINKGNVMRMFSDGAIHDVTTMVNNLENVRMDYDVLQYKVGANMFRFFVEGKDFNN